MKKKISWPMFGLGFLLVAAAGFIQNTDALNAFGVKPNLTLVVLVALSFFVPKFYEYLILVLEAVLLLRFETRFEVSLLIFAGLAFVVFWLCEKMPSSNFLNNMILAGTATILFYLISDWFFFARETALIFKEAVYNIAIGMIVFSALNLLNYGKKNRTEF